MGLAVLVEFAPALRAACQHDDGTHHPQQPRCSNRACCVAHRRSSTRLPAILPHAPLRSMHETAHSRRQVGGPAATLRQRPPVLVDVTRCQTRSGAVASARIPRASDTTPMVRQGISFARTGQWAS